MKRRSDVLRWNEAAPLALARSSKNRIAHWPENRDTCRARYGNGQPTRRQPNVNIPRISFMARIVLFAAMLITFVSASSLGVELDEFFSFPIAPDRPEAALVQDSNGNFYGTSVRGGAASLGTVFKMTPNGALTTLVSFAGTNGGRPAASLIQASDGNLYGTTSEGGNFGAGTVFRMTMTGILTTLFSFTGTNGSSPQAALLQASDNNFYGTTRYGGVSGNGTVFKMTPEGALTTLVSFATNNGAFPWTGLIQASNGNFYGTTVTFGPSEGRSPNYGTVFEMTPAGDLTTMVSFNGTNGGGPSAFIKSADGNLYGVTTSGGVFGNGTVFKLTPAGEFTTLASLAFGNGDFPVGLVEANDGNFYGTALYGGIISKSFAGWGTVFRVTPDGVLTPLVFFASANGSNPSAGVIQGNDGNFYGTTRSGGTTDRGTIFRMTPSGHLTSMSSFADNGRNPNSSLVEGNDGVLFGTASEGGSRELGSVFKLMPSGKLTTLVSFDGTNGGFPLNGLVKAGDGNFYGTTSGGTRAQTFHGTVFKMTPQGILTSLVDFSGANGANPTCELIFGTDGALYGTTSAGGTSDFGTVFKIILDGGFRPSFTTLFSFHGNDGRAPSRLVEGKDGSFYGTTVRGGAYDRGTAFRMIPSGELTSLTSFSSSAGYFPRDGLVEGISGYFYGTTSSGGARNRGTAFMITPVAALVTLVSFGDTLGSSPNGLIAGSDGSFYGTTAYGGTNNRGTVFRMTPAGTITTLASFVNGSGPQARLVQSGDGNFYGTTVSGGFSGGGDNGGGTIFRFTVPGIGKEPRMTSNSQPRSQSSIVGTKVLFSVTVTGTPPLRYQWRFNGADLFEKTSATLIFNDVELTNAGAYTVVVTNAVGSITSMPAVLSVFCDYAFNPFFTQFDANGGFTNIAVDASGDCPWTVSNTNPWITVTNGSGAGDGSFSYIVDPNPGLPRAGFLTISNKIHAVAQAGVLPPGRFDFTGDQLADVLFQRSDGTLAAWAMNGTNFLRSVLLRNGIAPSAAWRAFGQGDFNGDGKTDVVFENRTNGKLAIWFMDGTNFLGSALLRNGVAPAASWHAVSAADFNCDGKPDILFQNDNRTIAVWLMNGTNFVSGVSLRNGIAAAEGWRIVGTGDFNGYGQTDLIWQHTDGRVAAWQFVGTTFVGPVLLRNGPAASTGWRIRGVTDIDLDGKTDLLLQNSDGRTLVWLFDKTTFLRSILLKNIRLGWQVVGPR
jgi:uncharacterized repeat protein (TIGR03803 family)